MKKHLLKYLFLLLGFCFTYTGSKAQAPGCDPCGPWIPRPGDTTYFSFTFTLPYRPGCSYRAMVGYETRNCMGQTEVRVTEAIFEEFMPGPACDLHCSPDAPTLEQMVLNQIMLTTGPILKIEPSSCYYTGTIVVPPGAEVCYGMTPGSTRYVLMPCDTNGCCFSQITPVGTYQYNQHVLSSTPCPNAPLIPPSTTITWSCDILGGGVASFVVPFTPDSPLTCEMTCNEGLGAPAAKNGRTENVAKVSNNYVSQYSVYPNPVNDQLNVSFNSAADNEAITIELYNIGGQKVNEVSVKTTTGKQTIHIDAHKLAPGIYTCKFKYGGNVIITKVVK